MSADRSREVQFEAHAELLQQFLNHRGAIVESVQGLLNAQHKPAQYRQDRAFLQRQFEDCFFSSALIIGDQAGLRGQLRAAHRARGFRPTEIPAMHNDLVDPAEMMIRGFNRWQMTRWPGRNGRARYAQTLFNLYMIQSLELLVMRLWDTGPAAAGQRLARLQGVLDQLWRTSPPDQPVLVRDVRWLIPVAQSPGNEELAPYFQVAEQLAGALSGEEGLEIHKAGVLLAGGHLRSQLRHYMVSDGEALADNSLVLRTRRSNALDFALALQSLVPMLEAYERACRTGDQDRRFELAGAICQGVSPDPELFVNRVDLLAAYTMIEYLFITADGDGCTVLSSMGQRHVGLVREYAALITRMAPSLHEDCPRFRPVAGSYSPYGVMYGFSNNLLEHMAAKTLGSDAVTRFSLEDVFDERDRSADKLAWVSGWRKAPHISPEVLKLYEYPHQFAAAIFERIERALDVAVAAQPGPVTLRTGRLFIPAAEQPAGKAQATQMPELPVQYVSSSDQQLVAAGGARYLEPDQLLHDRYEGMYLVSYQTSGGWVAISKDLLTDVLGTGRDARIAGLPAGAAEALLLMGQGLVVHG